MKKVINYNIKYENAGVYRVHARLTTPKSAEKKIENIMRHAEVSEKVIEQYLVEQTRLHGWPCLKYSNPNMTGYPDRLLVLPGGSVVWVELKSKGRKPAKIQQMRIQGLEDLGHDVFVIDNKADIDKLIGQLVEIYG